MTHFLGECGGGTASTGHRAWARQQRLTLPQNHPGQRPAVPCPHHQQVTRGSDANQDSACLAALDEGLDWWISGNSAPRRGERIPQALMGIFCPDAAQVATR